MIFENRKSALMYIKNHGYLVINEIIDEKYGIFEILDRIMKKYRVVYRRII